MKSHHQCPCISIGISDVASLTLRTPSDVKIMEYGEDGSYSCFLADPDTAIPDYYSLVYECEAWLKIYDDYMLCAEFFGEKIEVYRAGDSACIVKVYPHESYRFRCIEYYHEMPRLARRIA